MRGIHSLLPVVLLVSACAGRLATRSVCERGVDRRRPLRHRGFVRSPARGRGQPRPRAHRARDGGSTGLA